MASFGYKVLSGFAIAAFILSCSPQSSKVADARHWMNERNYARVAESLRDAKDPEEKRLLAQAYLGLGGFEFLSFVDKTISEQATPEKGIANFTGCATDEINLTAKTKTPGKCLLFRLGRQVPNLLGPEAARAQYLLQADQIYRTQFSDIAHQDPTLNFECSVAGMLAALVHFETLNSPPMLERLRAYPEADANEQANVDRLVIGNLKALLGDLRRVLSSLRGSYKKIGELLKKQDGKKLVSLHGVSLNMAEDMDETKFVSFAQRVYLSYATELLKESQKLVKSVPARVRELVPASVDRGEADRLSESLLPHLPWLIDQSLGPIFAALMHASNPRDPPRIQVLPLSRLENLRRALDDTWQLESSLPLRQWITANEIWLERGLSLFPGGSLPEDAATREEVLAFLNVMGRRVGADGSAPQISNPADLMTVADLYLAASTAAEAQSEVWKAYKPETRAWIQSTTDWAQKLKTWWTDQDAKLDGP